LLNAIDPFKATGPDSLPPKLLKELSHELTPCLTLLFKASIHQSTLPLDWKTALVMPLLRRAAEVTLAITAQFPLQEFIAKYWNISFIQRLCHI